MKKQNNGIYSIRKKGHGVSLKDENEMALAKKFYFFNFQFFKL